MKDLAMTETMTKEDVTAMILSAKKQAGITFILVDMDQPGVDVRPIKLISGDSPFCEVFFDNVKAEKKHVMGDLNKGWGVAKALLGHERTMIAEIFQVTDHGRNRLISFAAIFLQRL